MIASEERPSVPPARAVALRWLVARGPLALSALAALGSAVVSLHLFSLFGLVPGAGLLATALVGVLAVPPVLRHRFSSRTGLLIQTGAATAALATALGLVLPIDLAAALDRRDLLPTVLVGATAIGAATLASMRWWFGSPILPADAPWPPGQQAAAALASRRVGLWRASLLALGLGAGHGVGALVMLPLTSAFGLALLGHGYGLGLLALGALVRPTLPLLLGVGPKDPQPFALMLGAAAGGLLQASLHLLIKVVRGRPPAPAAIGRRAVRKALLHALVFWLIGLAVFAASGGPTPSWLLLPVLLAGLALLGQLFGCLEAAWLGWTTVLGGALVVVAVVLKLQLPLAAGLVLVALSAPAGALGAELGYQLKAGRELGQGGLAGQQVIAALLGLAAALLVVWLAAGVYLDRDLLAPPARALGFALQAGEQRLERLDLLVWMVAGALIQWLAGPGLHGGVLLGTGLIIGDPLVGWALLAGLGVRLVGRVVPRLEREGLLASLGLGCIAAELLRGPIFGP